MKRLLLAGVLGLVCLTPASAIASRAPTPDEQAQLKAVVEATWGVLEPQCYEAKVTDQAQPGQWALVYGMDKDGCRSQSTLYQLQAGRWVNVFQDAQLTGGGCPLSLPVDVAMELGLCTRPDSQYGLMCIKTYKDPLRYWKARPRDCNTLGEEQSYGEAVNLKQMKWLSWGGPTAFGRGISRSWKNYGRLRYPVRVRAWRPKPYCETRDFIYTRMQLSIGKRSGGVVTFPECE